MILTWIVSVIFSLVWTYQLSQNVNRDKETWMVASLIIGIFAPLFLLVLPNLSKRKCDACAEMVKKEAKICRYCRSDLPVFSEPQNITNQKTNQTDSGF
jgi:hypothetical protein